MNKKLKTIIIIVIFIMLVGCGNAGDVSADISSVIQESENEPVDAFDKFRQSTVMIYAGEIHGSGVVFYEDTDSIKIATVVHVIGDNSQGIIQFYDGKTGFGDVVYVDPVSDIAILNIKIDDFTDGYGMTIPVASCEEEKIDSLKQNDKVFLVGSAMHVGSNVTMGEIGSTSYYIGEYDQYLIYLYADAMAGMSGSGCYSEDGILIGILSAGSENSEVLCININEYFKVLDTIE